MLPILQISHQPSQTIGVIQDLEFSLVGKIWDGLDTVKSKTVWDFPDKWKPGISLYSLQLDESDSHW